jgi:signal transduction histidine kinase
VALPRSIRGLLVALVVAVALPVFGVLAWGFWAEVTRQHAEASDLALRIARSIAGDVAHSNDRSRALLARMAQRPKIRVADAMDCDSLFAIVDFFPQYLDLILYDEAGNPICSATPAAADAPFVAAVTPALREHIRRTPFVLAAPLVLNSDGRWISVGFERVLEHGLTTGVLALVQYLDLDVDAYPAGTVITIVDREGRIVARTREPEKWIGRFLPDPVVRRMVLSGREGRTQAEAIDGEARQYGFSPVRSSEWVVLVGLPAGTAMAAVRSLVVRGAVAGAIILGLVIVLALQLSRAIERPLDMLALAAQRIGEEGFAGPVPADGPQEIAVVAKAFNRMVESRADAERALIESRSRLEALSKKLLEVQEEERSRIAREIHDELGQLLTALNMDIGGLLKAAPLSGDQEAMASRIRKALDATTSSVQRISAEIRPAALDDFGLVAAIESAVRVFERRTGIECELSFDDEELSLGSEADAAIYRIVQEAMTNIARHSDATRMEIRLRNRGGEVLIDVRDDGKGISTAEIADRRSLGILGMRERARSIGAALDVQGIVGSGTIVSLRVPIGAAISRSSA